VLLGTFVAMLGAFIGLLGTLVGLLGTFVSVDSGTLNFFGDGGKQAGGKGRSSRFIFVGTYEESLKQF
jgi:hypothetical protein